MALLRAAFCAALVLLGTTLAAQDITLTSRDGEIEISGRFLGYDGEFYRIDSKFGELTLDGSGVLCEGPACPNLSDYVAEISFSGASAMASVLMPSLVEGFALRNGYSVERRDVDSRHLVVELSEQGQLAARFRFRSTNTDEGSPTRPISSWRCGKCVLMKAVVRSRRVWAILAPRRAIGSLRWMPWCLS